MFSLRALLIVVAVAAVFVAALLSDSIVLVGLAGALTVALLVAATIAAIRSRAFVAFAVAGWSYFGRSVDTVVCTTSGNAANNNCCSLV